MQFRGHITSIEDKNTGCVSIKPDIPDDPDGLFEGVREKARAGKNVVFRLSWELSPKTQGFLECLPKAFPLVIEADGVDSQNRLLVIEIYFVKYLAGGEQRLITIADFVSQGAVLSSLQPPEVSK